MQLINE